MGPRHAAVHLTLDTSQSGEEAAPAPSLEKPPGPPCLLSKGGMGRGFVLWLWLVPSGPWHGLIGLDWTKRSFIHNPKTVLPTSGPKNKLLSAPLLLYRGGGAGSNNA